MKSASSLIFILVFTLLNSVHAAKSYEPGYLHHYIFTRLDNGMLVVLNPNVPTGNVAIRVGIRTGFYDYPYGKRQTPHFLEHLLFTGTSRYSEIELENRVTEKGASWNAGTGNKMTTYEIDVYKDDIRFGIELLHHILTDSTLSEENIILTRNIIHQEYDGGPSWLELFLYKYNVGRSTGGLILDYLYKEAHKNGDDLGWTGNIKQSDITQAYKQYYAPNNAIISIVGSFDADEVMAVLNNSFATWKKQPIEKRMDYKFSPPEQDVVLTGLFSPILGQRSKEIWVYITVDDSHPHQAALDIAGDYLNDRLYKRLRIETGLAYTPAVLNASIPEGGYFLMSPDVELQNMEQAVTIWQEELDKLLTGKVKDEDVLKFRDAYLISLAREEWTTGEIADYYADSLREWLKNGKLPKTYEEIQAVDMPTIITAVREHIYNKPKIIIEHSPTLTYTQFYILVALLVLLAGYVAWRLFRKYHKKLRPVLKGGA